MDIDTLRSELGDLDSERDVIDARFNRIEDTLRELLAEIAYNPALAAEVARTTLNRPL